MNFLNGCQAIDRIVGDMHMRKSSFENAKITKKRKVVFVIGSGVSNAVAGLPLGVDMAKNLAKIFVGTEEKEQERFSKEINRLVAKHSLLPNDFKTILFSLYKIYKQKIVDEVITRLSIKNIPRINFDIYATLVFFLKDNYVDGVINFNFDEIFEHAVSENNAQDVMVRVINTKDAENHTRVYDTQSKHFKIPIHLKPHGSVSTPSSLRFARKDFYRLEPLVGSILFKLLGEIPVTIVLIGFCMKNLDFTEQISKHLQPGSSLYVIDKKKDVVGLSLEKFYKGFIKVDNNNSLQDVMRCFREKVES
ncbi:MAG: SIR2 family protein [Patescibacteria group bacterium]